MTLNRHYMSVRQRIVRLLALVLCLSASTVILALEPPTPEQVKQYRADGTMAARVELAKSYGNHKMSPELMAHIRYKLRKLVAEATGDIKAAARMKTPPTGWRNMPTVGTVQVPVFLVAFADYPAYNEAAYVEDKISGDGVPEDYPRESLHEYYDRSSYGQLDIQADIYGWYTTAYNRSEVIENSTGRENLIKEVIQNFDTEADFSVYDNDGNGAIDYFAIIWAGPHGEWAEFWWGYQTHFQDSSFTIDGVGLDAYSWQWETRNYPETYDPETTVDVAFKVSTLIHETGHALGLPDYYDYDGDIGPDGGVGRLDMMAGSWGDHNCFSKWVLDWITPAVQTNGIQTHTLNPAATSGDAVIFMPGIAGDTPFDEYFMVQYRTREDNDATYPNDGLLIWHVNAELYGGGYNYVYDNSYTEFKLLRLMEADGLEQIEQGFQANAGDYYLPGNTFTPMSTPNSNRYDGETSRLWINDITQNSGTISFAAEFAGIPVFLPHYTIRSGIWSTRLSMSNEDPVPAFVKLTAYGPDGVEAGETNFELPSGGGMTDLVDNLFPVALPDTGWIKVAVDGDLVSSLMTFQYLPTGAASSLTLTPTPGSKLIFPLIEHVDGRTTGFSLVNLGDLPSSFSVKLQGTDGTTIAMKLHALQPGEKMVAMLEEYFGVTLPERAILKVQGDGSLAGFALTFTEGNTNVIAVPANILE